MIRFAPACVLSLVLAFTERSLSEAAALGRTPFLESYCFDCHDSTEQKGKLRLDDLKFDPADPANAKTWVHVLERIEAKEMPPKKKDQPPEAERVAFANPWNATSCRRKRPGRKRKGASF